MAIGRPLNLTPNVATKNISVVATVGQTSFTVAGGYRINEIGVYRNGTRLVDGRDFTATDGVIVTLLSAATVGDVLEFAIFDSFNIAGVVNTSGDSTIDGNLTATAFYGDGQYLDNISSDGGLGTPISDASSLTNQIYYTAKQDTVAAGTSVSVESGVGGGGITFTKLNRIDVGTGATFHVESGTTLIMNVLGVF